MHANNTNCNCPTCRYSKLKLAQEGFAVISGSILFLLSAGIIWGFYLHLTGPSVSQFITP